MKNFQELYDVSDMKIAKDVRNTFNLGLSRVSINAPSQIAKINQEVFKEKSSSANVVYKTLKLEYAIQVWYKAALISKDNPGDGTHFYWWLHWVNDETPFRHLEYSNFYSDITIEELNSRFWQLLERIANTREIKVSEGFQFNKDTNKYNSVNISCDVIVDCENAREICVKDIYNYPFCEEKKSFTWEEIKDFFCELTLPQLELVFYENIQRIDLTKYAWHRDLEIWREEYIKHIIIGYSVWRNEEWLDWWCRGYALAKQLCKILPSNIRLGYGNFEQCNNVISKWGSRWELNTKGCKVIVSADMSQKSKEGLFIQKAYIDYAFDEDELLNYKFEVDQDCHRNSFAS